jgi:hypothetical protein
VKEDVIDQQQRFGVDVDVDLRRADQRTRADF